MLKDVKSIYSKVDFKKNNKAMFRLIYNQELINVVNDISGIRWNPEVPNNNATKKLIVTCFNL